MSWNRLFARGHAERTPAGSGAFLEEFFFPDGVGWSDE
jgi:hypothetical protein